MPAAKLDLTIEEGANWRPKFTWLNSAGTAIDLTAAYAARLQIRSTKASASTLLSLTSGVDIALGADGTITVDVDAVTTAALSFIRGYYDLELEKGGVVTRLLEGKVELVREVTR